MTTFRANLKFIYDADRTWMSKALCRFEDDVDLFFPSPSDEATETAAKTLCGRCPVRVDCLEKALLEERRAPASYRHGIRGGLNPAERYGVYRRRDRMRATQRQQAVSA